MAAARTVKLKPDPKPKAPAIRIYRDEGGFSFIVGTVNKDGVGDFRTESLHNSFEEAVKQAQSRADQFRLPLINDTGVEIPTKAQPSASRPAVAQTKAAPKTKRKTAEALAKELDELPDPCAGFRLPQLEKSAGIAAYMDSDARLDHAHTWFRERRAAAVEANEQIHGNSRDHVVSYTQKTHDQIQAQIFQLYGALLDERATMKAYLEAAFARLDALGDGKKLAAQFQQKAEAMVSEALLKSMSAKKTHRTVVTGHDQNGRISEFTRYEMSGEIDAQIEEMQKRIDELERRPSGLNYRGVYHANETYAPNDVVTWGGSAWTCKRQTTDKPGEGDRDTAAWQLMVKKGRDGKDIRDRKNADA